jgi:dTDP-4-dehydrorhamnose reductase
MGRILIIGASGMLGYGVSTYFRAQGVSIVELTRKEYDIAKEPISKFEDFLDSVSIVINCSGVIKPMISRTPIEDILKVNAIFPRNLAKLCKAEGIKCFHITTDCVYSGRKGQYTEVDIYDAEDVYGLSKAAGEPTDCMTLRTSLIGEEKGQARSLLSWAMSQRGKEVPGFVNHLWNGVTTIQLAKIIDRILSKGLYREGIYHVFSPDIVSKAELLEILNDIYDLQLQIRPVKAENDCDRTLSSVYDLSSQVCREPIKNQVQEMKMFFELKR